MGAMTKSTTATSVEEYLQAVASQEMREALKKLRAIILEELPQAKEVIAYGIPCYKQNGYVAGYAAFKNHCSFFPGHTVADFAEALQGFKVSKGTVQFKPSQPIPDDLVRAMLRHRADENSS